MPANNSDLNVEIAVTKRDVEKLENSMEEVKDGIKELNATINTRFSQIETDYVKKNEFKEYKDTVHERFEKLTKPIQKLFWYSIAGIITLLVYLFNGHWKP